MADHQLDRDAALILGNALHFLLADGQIDDRELDLLREVASRHGTAIPSDQASWRKLAETYERESTSDPDVARHCLAECFVMMVADEEIHEAERRAWVQLAVWFGASAASSREILDRLERNQQSDGVDSHGAVDRVLQMLRELPIDAPKGT